MKFFILIIISTFIYLSNALLCGSQCNRSKTPNGFLSGNIQTIDKSFDISGTIVIKNDCEFEVQKFSVSPSTGNVNWYCANSPNSFESILVAKDVQINNVGTSLIYDVYDIDPFCKVSLLTDCSVFRLIDENYKVLASATLEGK